MPADEQPENLEIAPETEPLIEPTLEPGQADALPLGQPAPSLAEAVPSPPRGIAPIWHTLVLVIAILGFSYWGADRGNPVDLEPITPIPHAAGSGSAAKTAPPQDKPARTNSVRLIRYGLSGVVELVFLGWILFGIYLRKVPFRSLLGALPRGLNQITTELGVAALFWIGSMVILACLALAWNTVQEYVYQHHLKETSAGKSESMSNGQTDAGRTLKPGSPGATKPNAKSPDAANPESPRQQQAAAIRKLMELAPANGMEVAAWGFLCLLVGFSEEIIFRGYLQTQGIALLRSVPIGMFLSALVFGAAHGYQGMRGMCLITLYGGLFGGIALLRRNLLPGMVAHSWHDFATGMALAMIRSAHLLDHLPSS